MSSWQTCCRGRRSNCPRVKLEDGVVSIQDDDGNIVTMTLDQLQDVYATLYDQVSELQQDADPSGTGI